MGIVARMPREMTDMNIIFKDSYLQKYLVKLLTSKNFSSLLTIVNNLWA